MRKRANQEVGAAAWWRTGVLYQIYPRSFADSNRDGVGDLGGILARLDYLAWIGVNGLWLSPIFVSPNDDWGYDVADYCAVDPELGDLDDVDALVAEGAKRGIRVLLDLVPNHTSDRHPWFLDARSGRWARHRDWYVWADPKPDGSPPNNWLSLFGGPAWTFDHSTGQYYLHNFLPSQPDLNWWNEEVREAFDAVLRFWFDRGIAGFRIDVAHAIVKDRELRDNPPATEEDHPLVRRHGQRRVYNMMRPELHDVLRSWRMLANRWDPPRVLIGEGVLDLEHLASFYGTGEDELHMTFNFAFVHAGFEAAVLQGVVERTEALLPNRGWPVWTLSNHDTVRFPTRWCGEDDRKVRCALLALLTLRGTPVLYYGDEIGLPSTPLTAEDLRDPVGKRLWPEGTGRDPARTPMHWTSEAGAGFTEPGMATWLPIGDYRSRNVEDQRNDPGSILNLCRDLIALRQAVADLREGEFASLPSPPEVWAWGRGASTVVALNLSDTKVRLEEVRGRVLIATRREREGDRVEGELRLSPWEGVVMDQSPRE